MFLESVCTDPKIIDTNISVKASSGDPDYSEVPREQAERDFRERIKQYEKSYQTIDPDVDQDMTYAKIIDVGHQVVINRIDTYLQSRIVYFIMNLYVLSYFILLSSLTFECRHLMPRSIFFTRHGESQFNLEGKIGGDALLSERGQKYADALPKLIKDNIGDKPLTVRASLLFISSVFTKVNADLDFYPAANHSNRQATSLS